MTPEQSKRAWEVLKSLESLNAGEIAAELARLRKSEPAIVSEVEKCLAARDNPQTLDHLGRVIVEIWGKVEEVAPTPQSTVRGDEGDDSRVVVPAAPEEDPDATPPALPGYVLKGGKENVQFGGMGVVYFGTDKALGRSVAVKMLRRRFANEPESVARFDAEARINAQLQHPGIVPVHQVGKLADGRSFYTMKRVRGETLFDVLKRRPSPLANLMGVLAQFRRVCEAMAYAHDRNVLHRDLKPGNVMVGNFGEVLLMDWGLAKFLGDVSPEPTSEFESQPIDMGDSGSAQGLTRGPMGTLPYMPPEQAAGLVEQIDKRSDVFGLGAILCTIMTGKPPYIGETVWVLRRMAMDASLDEAYHRLAQCDAEPELAALTRKCLSPRREDRPADAGEVAKAVGDFIAGVEERLRKEELDRKAREVRDAEEQKRKLVVQKKLQVTVTMAIAIALVTITGAIISSIFAIEARHRAEQESIAKEDALKQTLLADENEKKATENEKKAIAARSEAEESFLVALENSVLTSDLADELKMTVGIRRKTVEKILRAAEASYERLFQRVAATDEVRERKARLLNVFADLYTETAATGKAMTAAQEAESLYQELCNKDPKNVRWLSGLALSHDRKAYIHLRQGHSRLALESNQAALAIREELLNRDSNNHILMDELASSHYRVSSVLIQWRDLPEARRAAEKGFLIRQQLMKNHADNLRYQRNLAWLLLRQSEIEYWAGDYPKAEGKCQEGLQLALRLHERDPGNADWLGLLCDLIMEAAVSHQDNGRLKEARKRYTDTIAMCAPIVNIDPEHIEWQRRLMYAQIKLDELPDSPKRISIYKQRYHMLDHILHLLNARCIQDPEDAQFRMMQSGVLMFSGLTLAELARLGDSPIERRKLALDSLQESVQISEDLVRLDPDRDSFARGLGLRYHTLASFYRSRGDTILALSAQEKEQHIFLIAEKTRLSRNPKNAEYKHACAIRHQYLASTFQEQNRSLDAERECETAIALDEAIINEGQSKPAWQYELTLSYILLAQIKLQKNENTQGIILYSKALSITKDLVKLQPNNQDWFNRLRLCYDQLISAYRVSNRRVEAKQLFQDFRSLRAEIARRGLLRAIVKDRTTSNIVELSESLNRTRFLNLERKQVDGAILLYKLYNTIDYQIELAECYLRLAIMLDQNNELLERLSMLDRAADIYKSIDTNVKLIKEERDLLEAIEAERRRSLDEELNCIPKLISAEKTDVSELLGLAELCLAHKYRYRDAVKLYSKALAADPDLGEDPTKTVRPNAAKAAILATVPAVNDQNRLTESEIRQLRQQALMWLTAELATQRTFVGGVRKKSAVHNTMLSWLTDRDLDSVRDMEKLSIEERESWSKFWADVRHFRDDTAPVIAPPPRLVK